MAKERTRIAVIEYRLCQPEACGNYLCIRVCPMNKMGKDCITKKGPEKKPVIEEDVCTGCGVCPNKCPYGAISIINLSINLDEPIHRFGKNSFSLYRLPILGGKGVAGEANSRQRLAGRQGVVGIIGKNGIGKSTALKILSGVLVPNLGDYGKDAKIDGIIEHYRGKEMQKFFEGIKEHGMKVSYKPQHVDLIPNQVKGKVRELLEKAGGGKDIKDAAESLAISAILERNIENLSGGELQKTAIAAAMLKDASLYAFDEPSSYLDIHERFRVAREIRKIPGKGKEVVVIEHDLALLDYLSDYIHIAFGKPAAYGVISNPKTVKNGINEFLEGFIKDENLRFRDHEIRFNAKAPFESEQTSVFASYPAMQKRLGEFNLQIEGGKLMKGEVVGILGPNAIGKTTFVKMLAGIEKADNTELEWNYKISYKPQYLSPEKGKTVDEFLEESGIDREFYSANLEKKLSLKSLGESKLTDLSGGELQKITVSAALSREDCDIILLDEPSAYIDIEDRLILAEAVRKAACIGKKPVIVVDHDIVFQDYVSDKLIVFEGTPSKSGKASKAMGMKEGMNLFLKNMGISFRRDEANGRPRANKENSVMDREQKEKGEYYYLTN